jgi:uncharacterized protein YbjT (DUF2867 family)
LKILIFGPTGSAGGSILRVCLSSPLVDEVRAIARKQLAQDSPKLQLFIHDDFTNYEKARQAFQNVDACFFALGVSATQVSEESEYRRITRDFAVAAAQELRNQSPKAAFHFISGRGTNLNSRFMWARVKAEAERDLITNFEAICWRPAAIDGEPASNPYLLYRIGQVLMPLMKPFRSLYVTGQDIGRAMLYATTQNFRGRIIENTEIRDLADRARAE